MLRILYGKKIRDGYHLIGYHRLTTIILILSNPRYLYLTTIKINNMLRWAFAFLVIALIAAIFGFGNVAEGAAGIAKVLFGIFVGLFVLMLLGGLFITRKV